jgi:predicted GNAT superfamily acetyltransferase
MPDSHITSYSLRILETPSEMEEIENLERLIWPGSETDVVPSHLLLAAVHGGGLVVGASDNSIDSLPLVGFVFGFPGIYYTPDGPRLKHCSHQLGVLPGYRNTGIGAYLKRAQWQIVRHQGIDRITWTFDPLLSRNAHLNIAKLGAVCSVYMRNFYGDMRDEMNQGIPSDRLEVDWWVNSRRVEQRLSKHPRRQLRLLDFQQAEATILPPRSPLPDLSYTTNPFVLIEIPADFPSLKMTDPVQALEWRLYIRVTFEELFKQGYLITDFIYENKENPPRSYYVLCHGEATL